MGRGRTANEGERGGVSLDVLVPAFQAADDERRARALAVLKGNLEETTPSEPAIVEQERYLNQLELSKALGVHPTSVRRWNVPCHRFGRAPRYLLSEVNAYLDGPAFKRRLAELKRIRDTKDRMRG